MKGRNHELISLGLVLPFFVTIHLNELVDNLYLLLFMIGVAIGSLVPDVDATDARIMHGYYEYAGLFFKHAIYRPIAFLTGEKGHRKIMHRLKGMVLTIAMLTLIFLVIIIAYWILTGHGASLALVLVILSFFIGLSLGYCLHLFEDMHTVSGIQWTENGRTIRGPIRTGTKQEDFVAITYMIWGTICTFGAYSGQYVGANIGLLIGVLIILAIVFLLIKKK